MNKEDRFIKALYYSKDVTKDDILRVAEEIGLVVSNKRMAKDKLIREFINQDKFQQLCFNFKEFLYVPVWEVADYYNLNTEEVDKLAELGVIKEEPKEKGFWSQASKSEYTANTYPLEVLDNYTEEQLKEAYAAAYSNVGYNIRIETETREEADALIQEIDKVFEITRKPSYYNRRSHGLNTYFTVKKLNNSMLEKTRYRLELDKKEQEIKKLKAKHKEEKAEIIKRIGEIMGIDDAKEVDIIRKVHSLRNANKELEELRLELEQSKLKRKNAGRKARFTEQEIATMQMYQAQGKSMREIAKIFECSVATVHKWIGEHEGE